MCDGKVVVTRRMIVEKKSNVNMKDMYRIWLMIWLIPVTSTKPTGDVNIQNSNITIRGNRLELRPGTQIGKNFKFQNR